MKTSVRLMAIAFVCGLTFSSANLFAQTTARVPIGRPTSAFSHAPLVPSGPTPLLPSKAPTGGGLAIGQSYDGIDFLGSNCGCLPPDTNAAVGNDFIAETVNIHLRVWNRIFGNMVLNEPLATTFGAPSGGELNDPAMTGYAGASNRPTIATAMIRMSETP